MRVIAYVLAAALLFAGCAEDKPREPAKTATSSPTVAVPSMPAQAMSDPPEGAAAFVTYYIALFNYAAETGNTAPMLALSSNCEACSKYARNFEAAYSRGDHIAGKLWDRKTTNLKIHGTSIDVLTTVQMIEGGKPVTYRVGFVLPTRPPYKVIEIFKGDVK